MPRRAVNDPRADFKVVLDKLAFDLMTNPKVSAAKETTPKQTGGRASPASCAASTADGEPHLLTHIAHEERPVVATV